MNFEFVCLIIIFTLLVILITFGETLGSSRFTEFISTMSKNISSRSIVNGLEI